ncbi:MAG: RHS repeat-associated core domain-containing protein, partial [Anaerolineae bacterium]|nr:RHS repeat-associated core domain-containing protein [Anaerolineae bacterium]
LTERDYTGQKENLELGLLYYNARFYVPGIGRFANADTIVPDPGNPQQLNRYAYVLNNSLRFTDPSGHVNCDGDSGDPNGACEFWINRIQTDVTQLFQFDAASSWLARELMELYLSLLQFATGPVNSSGFTPIQLIEYMLDYQSVTITRKSHAPHNPKALMSVTRTNTGIIKELTIYDRGLYHMTYDSRDRVWDRGGRRAHKDIAGSFAHEIGHIAVSRLGLNMGYYDQLLSRVHERDLQGVEIDKRGWSFNASRSPEEDFAELVSYNLCVNLCADLSYIRHPASGAGPGLVRQNVFNSWVNNGFLNSRNRGQ